MVKILGIRADESNKRAGYDCFMQHTKDETTHWLLPVLRWSDSDIWQYVAERNLKTCSLYREGFSRIGCVLCPNHGYAESMFEIQKFPQIANNWKRAAERYVEARKQRGTPLIHKTGEEYFNWWIKR